MTCSAMARNHSFRLLDQLAIFTHTANPFAPPVCLQDVPWVALPAVVALLPRALRLDQLAILAVTFVPFALIALNVPTTGARFAHPVGRGCWVRCNPLVRIGTAHGVGGAAGRPVVASSQVRVDAAVGAGPGGRLAVGADALPSGAHGLCEALPFGVQASALVLSIGASVACRWRSGRARAGSETGACRTVCKMIAAGLTRRLGG